MEIVGFIGAGGYHLYNIAAAASHNKDYIIQKFHSSRALRRILQEARGVGVHT